MRGGICLRQEILRLLRKAGDHYLSGEEIAETLGVSRTAIWKHIKELRRAGYDIVSQAHSGYRLEKSPDLLTPAEIAPLLKTRVIGAKLLYKEETRSTNEDAKIAAAEGAPDGTVVLTEFQGTGHGRLSRGWFCPKGKGVLFSVLLRPQDILPQDAPKYTLLAAVAVVRVCRARGLDVGVIFDGDADRCMFVDETGAFIQPDYLIPVLAATFLPLPPHTRVIHDVRTSRAAIEAIRALGCEPVIGKVGHAYAKVLLREVDAVCGGELAGHYYFRAFHGCDSGELAALRILGAFARAKADGRCVSRFMAPICWKYANSGEVNFKVADKPAAIARVLEAAKSFGAETGRTEIDGVRLEFAPGWISVRPSNTEPYLRLIAECDTPARLAAWMQALSAAIGRS